MMIRDASRDLVTTYEQTAVHKDHCVKGLGIWRLMGEDIFAIYVYVYFRQD